MAYSLAAKIEKFLLRELGALRREVESYPDELLLWALPPGLPNSAGTLALHIAGNLRHYIGARLGGSGYVRDREEEFAARDVPRAALLDRLAAAEEAIRTTLHGLSEERLAEPYPEAIRGHPLETGDFLVHLAVHLGYHLGQVSYHRRLVTGDVRGVGALDPGEIRV
jgi:hypothetical protein